MSTDGRRTVLFLHHSTGLGGSEQMLVIAMRELAARGYRVLLACHPRSALVETARAEGIPVLPCEFPYMRHRPRAAVRYLRSVRSEGRRIHKLAEQHSATLLHAYSPVAALYGVRAARRLGLPLLVHMHDAQPPKWARRWVIRYLSRRAAALLCVSRTVQSMLVEAGVPTEGTRVVPNAVSERFFDSPEPAADAQGAGPSVGLFAQIVPWKGQHVFLAAAAEIAKRIPAVRFFLVGTLVDPEQQPYLDRLSALARSSPLTNRVTITGFKADVDRWMAAMDVVVHASVEPEAFGLVIAEAMALGKPVVATDVGGPGEIIEDGKTGRIVPPGDAAALAEALTDMLGSPDPEMGIRASAVARERFSPEAHGTALAQLYDELLDADAAPAQ